MSYPRQVSRTFIARRWWRCRKHGHMLRTFKSSTRRWRECYCGLNREAA